MAPYNHLTAIFDKLDQAEEQGLLGRFLAIANGERLVDAHGLVADRGDGKAHLGGELVVGLALDHSAQDLDLAWC